MGDYEANLVDVIIPTYNRAEYISKSIESVLNQTHRCNRIIVVDDCSTDNTEDVVNNLKDERIVYHRLDRNRGANHCRNVGIQLSKTDIIAFNDSDDIWHPNKLKEQIELLKDCDAVFSPYLLVSNSDETIMGYYKPNEDVPFQRLLEGNVIGTPTLLVRREAVDKVGLFDEKIPRFQDWDFCLRLTKDCKVRCCEQVLLTAYRVDNSISLSDKKAEDALLLIANKYKKDIKERGLVLEWMDKVSTLGTGNIKALAGFLDLMEIDENKKEGLYKQHLENLNIKYKKTMKYHRMACGLITQVESVAIYLKDKGYSKIAVYGNSLVGRTLSRELQKGGLEVTAIIDKRKTLSNGGITVCTYEEFNEQFVAQVDCVINTVLELNEKIVDLFVCKPTINITDFL